MSENLETIVIFDEQQGQIRRRWYFWVIKFTLVMSVLASLFLAAISFLPEEGVSYELLVLSGITLVGSLLYLYVLYRCAYVKPGTKVLAVVLVISAVSLFANLVNLFTVPIEGALDASFRILDMIYESWVFYLNYLLRQINKSVSTPRAQ